MFTFWWAWDEICLFAVSWYEANRTTLMPIWWQRAMVRCWIRHSRAIRLLWILHNDQVSDNSVCWGCGGGLAGLHQSCLFCSPPRCAITGQTALLQWAGFLRPMKSHLALAPEYLNVMKIDFMACHFRARTILLEIQHFYTLCFSLWVISCECIYRRFSFPFLCHVFEW